MGAEAPRAMYEELRGRVRAVAELHRRAAVFEGAGRLASRVGLPLLAVTGLQALTALPFHLRAPVVPLVATALVVWGWRHVLRPLLE